MELVHPQDCAFLTETVRWYVGDRVLSEASHHISDIIGACERSEALMWLVPRGLIIGKLVPHEGHLGFLIWLAGGRGADVEGSLRQVEAAALEMGARTVFFISDRRGWERRKPPGYQKNGNTYSKDL